MIISQKTIEKLRSLINEETEYRSGPKLVAFFNKYGFADLYEPGFPSRWIYTESKLKELNGKPELDKCIKLWYLQPIITQYFIDNKSEIWLLFLIAHSKR